MLAYSHAGVFISRVALVGLALFGPGTLIVLATMMTRLMYVVFRRLWLKITEIDWRLDCEAFFVLPCASHALA